MKSLHTIRKEKSTDINELEKLYNCLNDDLSETTSYPGWIKGIYPVRQTAEEAVDEGSLYVLTKGDSITGSVVINHTPEDAYHQAKWVI